MHHFRSVVKHHLIGDRSRNPFRDGHGRSAQRWRSNSRRGALGEIPESRPPPPKIAGHAERNTPSQIFYKFLTPSQNIAFRHANGAGFEGAAVFGAEPRGILRIESTMRGT
jgi:hypothetical protein